ncbi:MULTISPECIES: CRISPR-associated ring nuclease Csm6 [Marichromatium]|uniref:CRISPR-associated Csx6 family protein n=1 Tax=Marichromatium gracile TaxID=1048 RepID=A0A4R4AAR8_MARGR|nr:CRISPR-associated ring nuclease Csm6 [Marichromatium gracile]KXX64822.1 CRISPR-associated protein [Marichromatium gracile]MBK1708193.1 TIGR02584 family CRISPR-associated protein [Marichromatium gracile]MBO8085983.1 TIGR02584 family CRISPR-associated protein [Marichromatium sp.]TCW35874.1 CRISPR-associated Csx6 family protein [Marichromatium gracile]
MEPCKFPRRIMIAVTGLSPQVVTETLFGLAVREPDPWIPTEVHIITTLEGAERARMSLLSPDGGWFQRLRHDYDLPEICFDENFIHVLKDADGEALSDIRTEADSLAAADQICAMIRGFCADDDSAVHVSIAGGRKTMGYYIGYALGLFGRPQDKLSHVLVSEPFESTWDFFYPTPTSRMLVTRDNKMVDACDARVTLAEIPFLRVRDTLPKRLVHGVTSFGEYVEAAQRSVEPPNLRIHVRDRLVYAAGEVVPMPPAQFAFYLMMVERRMAGLNSVRWSDRDVSDHFLSIYRRIADEGGVERVEAALKQGMTKEYFDQRKTLTNAMLFEVLGPQLCKPYSIHREGTRPRSRFGLTIDPEAIYLGP